jgi:hypothetical protein
LRVQNFEHTIFGHAGLQRVLNIAAVLFQAKAQSIPKKQGLFLMNKYAIPQIAGQPVRRTTGVCEKTAPPYKYIHNVNSRKGCMIFLPPSGL